MTIGNESLSHYLDVHTRRPRTGCDEIVSEIRKQMKQLLAIGRECGLVAGEVLLLINRSYMYQWDTIPANMFEEIKLFVKNNAQDYLKIVDPEYYQKVQKVLADGDWEKKHTFNKIAKALSMKRIARPPIKMEG